MPAAIEKAAKEMLDQASLSVEERLALIDRVASSSHFAKTTRLRDFLRFVGKQAVKANSPEIHEQEIGVRVFGRSPDYDRSTDNIVRVNATELRKRVDAYFANEGLGETIIFSIPRGSYLPVFQSRAVEQPQGTPESAPESLSSPAGVSPLTGGEGVAAVPHKLPWFWISLSAVLSLACIVLLLQLRSAKAGTAQDRAKPTVSAFWNSFTRAPHTDVVLPDEAVSMSEEMVGRPVTLSEYLDRNYMARFQNSTDMSSDRKSDLRTIFNHNLVTFGGLQAAHQVMEGAPVASTMHLVHSRFYEAESLKQNNLVLIGGKKANPWVRLFDDQVNFSLDYDDQHNQAFVANLHPHAGEQAQYRVVMDRNALYSYAVISYLPNPSRTGNVLIIAGADSDATSAAAEFLTSEESLRKFRRTLGSVGDFPYFEVILKTSRLSGTSFNAELVTWRKRS